ncbi:carboxymuconolactone decarboxylase family protein [Photobacterium phosphoreum]|uniref:carboxymuconolactone decarboxylase family protein n=1 Tax=Photobacterium phosphoreum TaxID=659 RepID=UPI000D171799|nr:carboxymuconolactone decarboxylase family protein [Photobacterium phosphoreum]PTB31073.1 hypothetical protein DAT36_18830 [Photobacterium phosphoreum]
MNNSFDKIITKIAKISPDIATCIDTGTHSINRREILDKKTTCLIQIASLATLGSCHKALKRSINEAIDADCSSDEILETMLQISFSCGLARSIDAIFEAKSVLEDRGLLKKKSKDKSDKNDDRDEKMKSELDQASDDDDTDSHEDVDLDIDNEEKDESDENVDHESEIDAVSELNKNPDNNVDKEYKHKSNK